MPLPDLYFLSFEVIVYILFGMCLAHARKIGPAAIWALVGGVLFGLLLEWATIQQLQAYEYGRFLIMLGEVPVAIGVAWGAIIYSVRQFSDATSLPGWARPVLDALLALNIDLAMDAIAIRLGFWMWGIPIESQFFGVPYANFWAWFWVVFSFSAGIRLLLSWKHPIGQGLAPPGAIFAGVIGVLATNRLIVSIAWNFPVYLAVIIMTLLAALTIVFVLRPRLMTRPPRVAAWLPAAFHAYFLVAGFLSGIFFDLPALLLISLIMALVAVFVHRNSF